MKQTVITLPIDARTRLFSKVQSLADGDPDLQMLATRLNPAGTSSDMILGQKVAELHNDGLAMTLDNTGAPYYAILELGYDCSPATAKRAYNAFKSIE